MEQEKLLEAFFDEMPNSSPVAAPKQDVFKEIVGKFVTRLGDPSKWTFEGEIIDMGAPTANCTCDHPIRYVFVIHGPDGATAPVGSECINHFQSYNPALWEKMQKASESFWAARREQEKAEREAAHKVQAEAAKILWQKAKTVGQEQIDEYRKTHPGYWLPGFLYSIKVKLNSPIPVYKRTKTYVDFYQREAKAIYSLVVKHLNDAENQQKKDQFFAGFAPMGHKE